jgi:hypothetical protein
VVNIGLGETNMSKKPTFTTSVFDFDDLESPETEWRGMPEFNQPDNGAFRQIIVSFDDQAGVDAFEKLIGQTLTDKTKSLWFPPRERNNVVDIFYVSEDKDE